jgi:hypothetical protein
VKGLIDFAVGVVILLLVVGVFAKLAASVVGQGKTVRWTWGLEMAWKLVSWLFKPKTPKKKKKKKKKP